MSRFTDSLFECARAHTQHIVLPEGGDPRTIEAARAIAQQGLARLTVLGDPAQLQLEGDGITVLDPRTSDKREAYANKLLELRQAKGMTAGKAHELMDDELYFGTMMVKMGDADGMTSGACHTTGDVIRPALQILKCAPGQKAVSSFFAMSVPDCGLGEKGLFFFADCGLNTYPDTELLATIAIQTAESWSSMVGTEPRVAMLSYSSKGSATQEEAKRVAEATELAKSRAPELLIDGEMQLDAALVPEVAASKAPGSPVAGKANILIFPNIDAGNIGYKLVQRLAKAEAIGPVLQGLAAPVNDLSRGCSAQDIVGMVALTAVQAYSRSKA